MFNRRFKLCCILLIEVAVKSLIRIAESCDVTPEVVTVLGFKSKSCSVLKSCNIVVPCTFVIALIV